MPGSLGWTYLDEQRTHQVRLTLAGSTLTIVESPFPDADATARVVTELAVADEWDARTHKSELEARLGMLGQYWRTDGAGWRPLPRRPAIVDLRAFDFAIDSDRRAALHHFHHPAKRDRLLLSFPGARPARALVAEFELDAFAPTRARVLHASLPPGPARSLLARAHLVAHEAGYGKIRNEHEFTLVYGPDWRARLATGIQEGVKRLGGLGEGNEWRRDEPRVIDRRSELMIRAEGILLDPRLRVLHARFLNEHEQEFLLKEGEVAITRAIQLKRQGAPAEEQHLLSILEASLLLRGRLRAREKLDEGLVERVERLAYYLPHAR